MPRDRKPLPALDNAPLVNKPDLPGIYDKNYTDTILKYCGLATRFPQLETNAKTIVAAINELYGGGGGDGKHRTLTQYEYDQLTEEEKNDGTIYFITDAPSVVVRPEDLSPENALPGQLLTFYNDYGDHGVWTATPLVRNPANGDTILWSSQYGTWVNGSVDPGKSALSELTDVSLNNLSNSQVLKYNSSTEMWENADDVGGVTELKELSDVYIQDYPADGDILRYDSRLHAWHNITSPFATQLDDLSDVSLNNKTYGQLLRYDGSKWVNVTYNINDIHDVYISLLQPNQILKYTAITGSEYAWVNADFVLSQLNDITLSSLSSNQVLKYNGTTWVNIDFDLPELNDVSINNSTLADGQVLKYSESLGKWVNASGGGGGAGSLDDLSDVSIDTSTLEPSQILQYNGSVWVNVNGFAPEIDEYVDNGNILVYDYGVWKNVTVSDAINLVDLADVSIDNLQEGEVLVYDSTTEKWVNASGGAATSLENLSDVSITTPVSGEILTYDGTEWFNSTLPVSVTQIQSTGTKIATITVDSVDTDLYAPAGGGGGGTAADITFDDTNVEFVADDVQEAFEVITKTLTTAEYNNLSSAEKNNGTIYLITDSAVSYPDLDELDNVNITSVTNGQLLKYDSATSKWVNGTGTSTPWVEVTGQLTASQTSVTLSDESITTDSTIDVYVDDSFYGVNPTAVTLATGSVTLTFEAQSSNMPVKVRVS